MTREHIRKSETGLKLKLELLVVHKLIENGVHVLRRDTFV